MKREILKKTGIVLGAINLIVLDFAVGFVLYSTLIKQSNTPPPTQIPNGKLKEDVNDKCGDECRRYIDAAITNLKKEEISVTPAPVSLEVPTVKKIKTTAYYPVPGSGETRQTSWTDLPGTDFYFDKSDFSGFKGAYLEANIKIGNGNGEVFLRIFDVTHGIAVVGSEVKTGSPTLVAVTSVGLSVWEGRSLYRVQAKSLTSESAYFGSGRIRIVSEN